MSPKRGIATPAPLVHIERRILVVRAQKTMLDTDLAALYGVTTSALVQAVKRNLDRFPDDFMFQLDAGEWAALRSQSVISNVEHNTRVQLKQVFEAIRELMTPPEPAKKRSIGFVTPDEAPTKPKAAKAKK